MDDDELDELFGAANLSEPYTYTNISTSSNTTPRPGVLLLLPTAWSSTDMPLAWHLQRSWGNMYGGKSCQQFPPFQPLITHGIAGKVRL